MIEHKIRSKIETLIARAADILNLPSRDARWATTAQTWPTETVTARNAFDDFTTEASQMRRSFKLLDGADLLIDLAKHAGHQVIVKNVNVFGADNGGALGRASGVLVKISTTGIDTETFRYFLKNCSSVSGCKVHLLVTPTGDKLGDWPVLAGVKIVE